MHIGALSTGQNHGCVKSLQNSRLGNVIAHADRRFSTEAETDASARGFQVRKKLVKASTC
jgi:hypothetical protein